jgi:hypothetical protein
MKSLQPGSRETRRMVVPAEAGSRGATEHVEPSTHTEKKDRLIARCSCIRPHSLQMQVSKHKLVASNRPGQYDMVAWCESR